MGGGTDTKQESAQKVNSEKKILLTLPAWNQTRKSDALPTELSRFLITDH